MSASPDRPAWWSAAVANEAAVVVAARVSTVTYSHVWRRFEAARNKHEQ